LGGVAWCGSAWAEPAALDRAFERMYNFDFAGAHGIVDEHMARRPEDPFAHTVRAAALLFSELDRLGVLEAEFLTNDKRLVEKKKLEPDRGVRERFHAAIERGDALAQQVIAARPGDANALFSLCLNAGLVTDYMALIEKRQLASLAYAKKSHRYALQVLRADPGFHDANLTTGLTEYLLGSVPFFVKWFVRFEQAEGDKKLAVARLERVAGSGRYLKGFAKILLCIIHLREKRVAECERLLAVLTEEFPENGLLRRELAKLRARKR